MSYTFLDAQSKLSVLLQDSNSGSDDAWPIALRKKEINRGEMQFAKDTKCARNVQTEATTAIASNKLALPADFLELVCLILNGYVISKDSEIAVQEYEDYKNYGGDRPYFYVTEESGVRYFNFIGVADGVAYSLHYIKKPSTELSGDSDVSIFPEEFREASVYYAAAQLLQQVGKSEYADRYLAIYTRLVRDGQSYAESLFKTRQNATPEVRADDCGVIGYDFGN